MAILQQFDGNAIGRAHESHMPVARRPVDRVARILQALAAVAEFLGGGLGWIAGFLTPLASLGVLGMDFVLTALMFSAPPYAAGTVLRLRKENVWAMLEQLFQVKTILQKLSSRFFKNVGSQSHVLLQN